MVLIRLRTLTIYYGNEHSFLSSTLCVCVFSIMAPVYVCMCMENVLINYKSNINLWTEHS